MAHRRMPHLGFQELAGVGFAFGTTAGAVSGALFGAVGDVWVPVGGALGAVVLPGLWGGAIKPLALAMARRRTARVQVTGLVA